MSRRTNAEKALKTWVTKKAKRLKVSKLAVVRMLVEQVLREARGFKKALRRIKISSMGDKKRLL